MKNIIVPFLLFYYMDVLKCIHSLNKGFHMEPFRGLHIQSSLHLEPWPRCRDSCQKNCFKSYKGSFFFYKTLFGQIRVIKIFQDFSCQYCYYKLYLIWKKKFCVREMLNFHCGTDMKRFKLLFKFKTSQCCQNWNRTTSTRWLEYPLQTTSVSWMTPWSDNFWPILWVVHLR